MKPVGVKIALLYGIVAYTSAQSVLPADSCYLTTTIIYGDIGTWASYSGLTTLSSTFTRTSTWTTISQGAISISSSRLLTLQPSVTALTSIESTPGSSFLTPTASSIPSSSLSIPTSITGIPSPTSSPFIVQINVPNPTNTKLRKRDLSYITLIEGVAYLTSFESQAAVFVVTATGYLLSVGSYVEPDYGQSGGQAASPLSLPGPVSLHQTYALAENRYAWSFNEETLALGNASFYVDDIGRVLVFFGGTGQIPDDATGVELEVGFVETSSSSTGITTTADATSASDSLAATTSFTWSTTIAQDWTSMGTTSNEESSGSTAVTVSTHQTAISTPMITLPGSTNYASGSASDNVPVTKSSSPGTSTYSLISLSTLASTFSFSTATSLPSSTVSSLKSTSPTISPTSVSGTGLTWTSVQSSVSSSSSLSLLSASTASASSPSTSTRPSSSSASSLLPSSSSSSKPGFSISSSTGASSSTSSWSTQALSSPPTASPTSSSISSTTSLTTSSSTLPQDSGITTMLWTSSASGSTSSTSRSSRSFTGSFNRTTSTSTSSASTVSLAASTLTVSSSTLATSVTPTATAYPAKRGLIYTNVTTLNFYPPPSPYVSWSYNYYSLPNASDNVGPYPPGQFHFIPLLFNDNPSLTSIWAANVNFSIANYGTDALFGFNEPDACFAGLSSCMSVNRSVTGYVNFMQPFARRPGLKIGSVAVTNAGQDGLAYLSQFLGNATRLNLTVDFINLHWYASPYNIQYFKDYVTQAYAVTGAARYPVWITEFGMDRNDYPTAVVQAFLKNASRWCDDTPWIERYAWFGNFKASGGTDMLLNDDGSALGPLGRIWNTYNGTG